MPCDVKEHELKTQEKIDLWQKSTDANLIKACQLGNKQAFNVLLKRYQPYINSLLYKVAADKHSLHEDYRQEVLLRIYVCIHTLRNPAAFKKWLYQMVCNLFYDDLRKMRGIEFVSLDEPVMNAEEESFLSREIPDYRDLPDVQCERKEIIKCVNSAIELLPKQFQKAIELREFGGLHYEAIAAITKTDLGTVKSRIARARTRMQATLLFLQVA